MLIKGYWKTNGKIPIGKEENRILYNTPPEEGDYCAVYENNVIQIDIDDYKKETFEPVGRIRGKEKSEILSEYLDSHSIRYNGIKTERGRHFIFYLPSWYPHETNKTDWYCALGFSLEAKITKIVEIVRIGGNERRFFKGSLTNERIDALPYALMPIQKGKEKPFSLNFVEGDRNNHISEYAFHLAKKGIPADEIKKIIEALNDYFLEEALPDAEIQTILRKETMQKLEVTERKKNAVISIESFREFMKHQSLSVQYNELTNTVEYIGIPDDMEYQSIRSIQNLMPVQIQYDFQKYSGKPHIGKHVITDLIALEADKRSYNPVKDYLQECTWDKKNRFPEVFEILGVEDQLQQIYLQKWFYQCVAMAFNSLDNPVQAEGVLILQGEEGIGKTRFLQSISVKPEWFSSLDKEISTKNKDILIQMLSVWIAEIGEIDRTFKANKSDMKSFITSRDDTIRKPYRMEQEKKPRTTSFCGTTNKEAFLNDDTGSRRWWIVKITKKIDMQEFLQENNLHQLWAQCYETYLNDHLCYLLSDDERRLLDEQNKEVMELLPAEEELRNRMDFEADLSEWFWCMPSALLVSGEYDVQKYTPVQIAKAIQKIMKDESRIQKKRDKHGSKYLIPPAIRNTDRHRNRTDSS